MKKAKIYYHYDLLGHFYIIDILNSNFLCKSARSYLRILSKKTSKFNWLFCYICLKTNEENDRYMSHCQDCGEHYCKECFHTPQHDLCLDKEHTLEDCQTSGRQDFCASHDYLLE